jgi:hypothetical protein
MGNVISKWRDVTGSQSLEDYLMEHFGDKTKFRVSRKAYKVVPLEDYRRGFGDKTTFSRTPQRQWPGAMRAAKCFVLQGTFRYSFGDQQFDLTEGDYCELPEGSYYFEILGDSVCVHVLVFTLPERQTLEVHQQAQ